MSKHLTKIKRKVLEFKQNNYIIKEHFSQLVYKLSHHNWFPKQFAHPHTRSNSEQLFKKNWFEFEG